MIILDENENSRTIKTNIKITKEIIQKLMENDALSKMLSKMLYQMMLYQRCWQNVFLAVISSCNDLGITYFEKKCWRGLLTVTEKIKKRTYIAKQTERKQKSNCIFKLSHLLCQIVSKDSAVIQFLTEPTFN